MDDDYLRQLNEETKDSLREAARKAYETMLQSKEMRHQNEVKAMTVQINQLKTELTNTKISLQEEGSECRRLRAHNVELAQESTGTQHRLREAMGEFDNYQIASKRKMQERETKILDKVKDVFRREMKKRNDVIATQQKALRLLQDALSEREEDLGRLDKEFTRHKEESSVNMEDFIDSSRRDTARLQRDLKESGEEAKELDSHNRALKMRVLELEETRQQLDLARGKAGAQLALFNEQQDIIRSLSAKLDDTNRATEEEKRITKEVEARLERMQHAWNLVGDFLEALPKTTLRAMRMKQSCPHRRAMLDRVVDSFLNDKKKKKSKGKSKTTKAGKGRGSKGLSGSKKKSSRYDCCAERHPCSHKDPSPHTRKTFLSVEG